MNLLTEDNHLFKEEHHETITDVEDYQKFKRISRYHSVGLMIYSLCTFLIFIELVILLIMYRIKGGVHGRQDFLYS